MTETREIKKVLATVNFSGWHWDKLAEALAPATIIQLKHSDTMAVLEAIKDVDVAILGGNISDAMLKAAGNLKWVHCDMAGVNDSAKPEIFERGIFLTPSAGRSAPVLAEHTFFLMLSLIYDSRNLEQQQRDHNWNNLYRERRGLYTKTIGIAGLGYTGKALAVRAKAFGMTVLGYDRISEPAIPEGVDKAWYADNGDSIDTLLKESDIVALAVRLCDETYHMINEKTLKLMKPTAYLVNMARGAVVDEKALYDALVNKTIAMAASDVFETEPLPKESPLWDLPNFVITPHCTPEVPDLHASSLGIICENIALYRQGKTLRGVLTDRDIYTMGLKG
jgi:phosphoglycerate dehydrogenase-like enzyme